MSIYPLTIPSTLPAVDVNDFNKELKIFFTSPLEKEPTMKITYEYQVRNNKTNNIIDSG